MSANIPTSSLASSADPVFFMTDGADLAWANEAFKRLAGARSPAEIFGAQTLRALCATSHYACYDIKIQSANGDSFPQSAVVLEIGSGDPGAGMFLVTLKSTGTEHSRLAAKEEYLATVAHDLRNPLSAIFSYADALVDTAAGNGLDASQKQIMKRIRSTAARCVDLVLNYQMLAQVSTKGFLRPRAPVDLNEVARSVVEHTWREDSTAPSLTCDFHAKALPVFMERVQIERALSNLVTNALKYTPPEGKIVVKTFEEGAKQCVSVSNSGVHLESHEIKKIFERYTRASSSEGVGGTGLGLFIVKTLMAAAGGSAEAQSDPKRGVTVTLYFPKTP